MRKLFWETNQIYKKVYKIDDELRSLTDGRINPTYQTGHVGISGSVCFFT